VIEALAGGDFGRPGHVYAFDARTGRLVWTFDAVAGGKSWKAGAATGGGDTWTSFAADSKDGLVLAPIGNPAPDFQPRARSGDNLYTNAVVALDAASGKLAWYEQQRPRTTTTGTPPPADALRTGRPPLPRRRSKDGHLYLYDRDRHALVARTAITTIENTEAPLVEGKPVHVCPGYDGGVEWNGPAYSPAAKAVFIGAVDWCGDYIAGKRRQDARRPDDGWTFAFTSEQTGWIRALDAAGGRELWSYHAPKAVVGGSRRRRGWCWPAPPTATSWSWTPGTARCCTDSTPAGRSPAAFRPTRSTAGSTWR